jgi:hypothetical protein
MAIDDNAPVPSLQLLVAEEGTFSYNPGPTVSTCFNFQLVTGH